MRNVKSKTLVIPEGILSELNALAKKLGSKNFGFGEIRKLLTYLDENKIATAENFVARQTYNEGWTLSIVKQFIACCERELAPFMLLQMQAKALALKSQEILHNISRYATRLNMLRDCCFPDNKKELYIHQFYNETTGFDFRYTTNDDLDFSSYGEEYMQTAYALDKEKQRAITL